MIGNSSQRTKICNFFVIFFHAHNFSFSDRTDSFVMNKLAFISISALPRSSLVPLLAHFSFIIFILITTISVLVYQLMMSMSITAIQSEITNSCLHELSTKDSLKIDSEIFNILQHLLARAEVHLLLLTLLHRLLLSSHLKLGQKTIRLRHTKLGGIIVLLILEQT